MFMKKSQYGSISDCHCEICNVGGQNIEMEVICYIIIICKINNNKINNENPKIDDKFKKIDRLFTEKFT